MDGEDSDEYYRVEYSISVSNSEFHISGIDRSDGEEIEISDIIWNGVVLTFFSYVPSTGRCGVNQMRYLGQGQTEFLFTFTVREVWSRSLPSNSQIQNAEPQR